MWMRGKGRTTCNLCQPVFKFNILFYILSGSYRSGLCSKTFLVKSRRRTHSAKPPILLSDLSYVCYLPLVFTLSREITGIGWCVTCFSGVYRGVLCFYFFLNITIFFLRSIARSSFYRFYTLERLLPSVHRCTPSVSKNTAPSAFLGKGTSNFGTMEVILCGHLRLPSIF